MTRKIRSKAYKNSLFLSTFLLVAAIIAIVAIVGPSQYAIAQNGSMQPTNNGMRPALDITIYEIEFSDDDPKEDDVITISVTIQNNESFRIENLTVIFLDNMDQLDVINGITIEANQTLSVDYTWTAEKWDHKIGAMLGIDETPLENTVTYKDISVEAKPIGDVITIVIALLSIFIVIFLIAILPSLIRALRG